MDHFFQLEGAIGWRDMAMLQAYTTLGYAAGVSSETKVSALVMGR
jgi:hypothetical protein